MICHDHLGGGHTTMISYLPVGWGNHGIIYNLIFCNHQIWGRHIFRPICHQQPGWFRRVEVVVVTLALTIHWRILEKIIPVIELYPKFKDHVCHSLETCYLVFPHDFVYDCVYQIIMLIHISFGYPLSHTIYITPQQFVR